MVLFRPSSSGAVEAVASRLRHEQVDGGMMPTLPGQRAQFTWSLRQYNLAESPAEREKYARRMAKYIAAAPANGFTVEEVTQGQSYPASEVARYLDEPGDLGEPDITEEQAIQTLEATVDTSDVVQQGEGSGVLYAYGYRCAPDRLKIGITEVDTLQRIAAQIATSTPDRPMLVLEIRTNACRALERAIHGILEWRGQKIVGGGAEWFRTTREEVLAIYRFISCAT
jgi:hypothetical protein